MFYEDLIEKEMPPVTPGSFREEIQEVSPEDIDEEIAEQMNENTKKNTSLDENVQTVPSDIVKGGIFWLYHLLNWINS